MEKPTQLTSESTNQLQEGIALLLSRWTALQMAVENEWGGRDSGQKSQQLAVDIFCWFNQSKEALYIDELENMLDDCMISLNTEIDDGSIEEIAEKLMIMHEECLEGNFISIERLKEAGPPRVAVPHLRQAVDDDEDSFSSSTDDDSSDMIVDPTESQSNSNQKNMMVNEPRPTEMAETDGWTVVASKRNKGRRN